MEVEEIFREAIAPLNISAICKINVGHCERTIALPLGVRVKLDADKKELVYLESAMNIYQYIGMKNLSYM